MNIYKRILDSLGIKYNHINSVSESCIEKNIRLIEGKFSTKIPKDYLEFISSIEQVTLSTLVKIQAKEKIPVASEDNLVNVNNFFVLCNNTSIIKTLHVFEGNIPNYVLPICESEAGDLIVIDMSNKNYGKVYYWHHEHYEDEEGLYLIAENFKEFMQNLLKEKENEDDSLSIDEVTIVSVSDDFLDMLKESGKI